MAKTIPNEEKLYFSIGEVARRFSVNTSLIRFWEKEFDIIRPKKNKKGNRLFTRKDIDNFHKIYHLVKDRGFTLQGAKDALKTNAGQVDRDFEISRVLESMKAFLLSVRKHL